MAVEQAPIEPTESLYLVALLPPSNVARAVGDLQAELFRRHGLASALGLGVLLPLAFSESPPAQPGREPVGRTLRLGQEGSLTTGGLIAIPARERGSACGSGGALYLEVAGAGSAEGAADAGVEGSGRWLDVLRASFPSGRGLFPLHAGFFLADLAELAARSPATELPAAIIALAPPPPLSWATSELACLALRFGRASSWWSFLEYETIWSVRLRRARPGYRSG